MVNFEQPVEIDFRPAVPGSVRSDLNKLLRSTTRIVISVVAAKGKARKVNAIRLNCSPGQWPRESLEDIAEAITAIMHLCWEDQELEEGQELPPPMEFVIVCEGAPRPGKARPRAQFRYTYAGETEADVYEDNLSVDEAATMRVLDLLERHLGQAYSHLDDMQERLLRIVEQNSSQARAGAELMSHAIPLFMAGTQQVLNAKTLEMSAARTEAREKATTERIEAALKTLAPFLGIGLQQFIQSKLGVQFAPEGDPANEGYTIHQEGEPEAPPQHPLATMARYFGEGLSVEQRAELNRILTRKQQACFDALFCSVTDRDAVAAYAQVAEHAADKLAALQALLSPEQTQQLGAFMHAVAKYSAPTDPPQA